MNNSRAIHRRAWFLCMLTTVHGCSYFVSQEDAPPEHPVDVSNIPDAVPKPVKRSKYGNPQSYEVMGKRYHVVDDNQGFAEQGIASWYGKKFHGRRTSSGDVYDMYTMTAAHKTLLIPAYVQVTNLENGKKAIVKVNDRGPFSDDRIIDLSYAAAKKLDMEKKGTAMVAIRVVEAGDETPADATKSVTKKYAPVETLAPSNNLSSNQLFIQVGAFSKRDNAENLLRKLRSVGQNLIKISAATVGEHILYRVRIGPLSDRNSVRKMVQKLNQLQHHEHHVIDN